MLMSTVVAGPAPLASPHHAGGLARTRTRSAAVLPSGRRAADPSLRGIRPLPACRGMGGPCRAATGSVWGLPARRQPAVATRAANKDGLPSAPAPAGEGDDGGGAPVPATAGGPGPEPDAQGKKIALRRVLRNLSSLPLALGEMAALAALCAVGTVVEQNKAYDYYISNYPLDNPVMGFLTYERLLDWGLDHIYVTPYFIGLNALLGASLAACSYTRQLPMVKVARNWKFLSERRGFEKFKYARELRSASAADLGALLRDKGYQVFKQGPSLYGFKGLAGRLAPIGVHVSMVLVMLGSLASVLAASRGTAMCPEGNAFFIGQAMKPEGPLAGQVSAGGARVFVNDFAIEYLPSGKVKQFTSDLSVIETNGDEVLRKRISVNDPLRYGGVTMYQTDWSLAAVRLQVPGSRLQPEDGSDLVLPMASLEGKMGGVGGRLWGGFLPTGDGSEEQQRKGVSVIARDPRQVVFYDEAGKFVGVRRPGSKSPITVAGQEVVVEGLVGATGLELKSDPGVPWVYSGFAGLMVTVSVSYFSHSQVWALEEEDGTLVVGGKSNRAVIEFETEISDMLELIPEATPQQQ